MGFLRAAAVFLHAAGAVVMTYAWMELDTLPQSAWIVTQKGGHFQYLTIQGSVYARDLFGLCSNISLLCLDSLFLAWLTMALSLVSDFTSLECE